MRALIILLICAAAARGEAHETWIGGKQVDPKTRDLCCSGADTRVVDDLVRQESAGVSFTDNPGEVIPFARIQVSPDGHWWRSIWGGQTRCVFGPYSY